MHGVHGVAGSNPAVPTNFLGFADKKSFQMFAVIYRFILKPEQEASCRQQWNKVANYFIERRGALGSCLHKGEDNLWLAYSRWPDKATRDAIKR